MPADKLLDRPLKDEPALPDHDQVVACLLDLGQKVRGDEHGHALGGEGSQQPAHLGDPGGIETVRRLVEDQQLRLR